MDGSVASSNQHGLDAFVMNSLAHTVPLMDADRR